MRNMVAAAAALALLLPCAALAEDHHDRGHGHRAEAQDHGRGHQAEARQSPIEGRRNFAENRDRHEIERRDFDRGRDFRGGRERGRTFNYRGRQYAAVRGVEFRYPCGWGYCAWHRGEILPRLFFAAPFFIDYSYLGLPPPPPGARWVRYGPDALLVDVYDDHIVDVIYNAFY